MIRWLLVFAGLVIVCVAGFYVIWLGGLLLNCAFMSGCFERLDLFTLLAAVNQKSIAVKGTLAAIVVMAIVWSRRRR